MAKKKNINLLDIYEELTKMLSIVFLNKDTISFIKTDDVFNRAVVDLIDICFSIEASNTSIQEPKLNDFLVAYQSINSKKIKPKNVPIDDVDVIKDKMNYLKVVLKNAHKIKWDDVVNSFGSTQNVQESNNADNKDSKKGKAKKQHPIEEEVVDAQKTNQSFERVDNPHQYQNSADFLQQNNISIDEITESIIKQQAMGLLNKDISENRFYQFDSKPKMFKWSKLGLYAMWFIFFGIFFALTVIGLVVSMENIVYSLVDPSKLTITNRDQFFTAVQNGQLFFVQTSSSWITFACSLIFLFYSGFYIYKQFRYIKNDNVQYAFKSMISWLIIFLTFINILWPIMVQNPNSSILSQAGNFHKYLHFKEASFTISDANNLTLKINNSNNYPIYMAYYGLTIAILVVAGIVLLVTISLMVIKPKLDFNRINQKIEEYYSDIKSGKIKVNSNEGMGFFDRYGPGRNPFSPY